MKRFSIEEYFNIINDAENCKKKKRGKSKEIRKMKIAEKIINNASLINNNDDNNRYNYIKKSRVRYSLNFKKKWVTLYKQHKTDEISLLSFCSLIHGKDKNRVIKLGSVNNKTFKNWIKLFDYI